MDLFQYPNAHWAHPCKEFSYVKNLRTLGAIAVVELTHLVDTKKLSAQFGDLDVWIRPFGNMIYLMPPFIIEADDLSKLTSAVLKVVANLVTK